MARVILECTAGPVAGQKIVVSVGQVLTIGRTAFADWSFSDDAEMSGRHFAVHCESDSCLIRDLTSTNGTYLNGVRLGEAQPNDGDEIRAGRTTFTIRLYEFPAVASQPSSDPVPVESPDPVPADETAAGQDSHVDGENSIHETLDSNPLLRKTEPKSSQVRLMLGIVAVQIVEGPHAGQQFYLRTGQALTVGATESADISLPLDPFLSGIHFELKHEGEACVVRDRKSANGVRLNNVKVRMALLRPGDIVQAGKSSFRAEFEVIPIMVDVVDDGSRTRYSPDASLLGYATENGELISDLVNGELEIPVEEPPIPLLEIVNQTPFAIGMLPWENRNGEARLTVIVKASFEITQDGRVEPAKKQLPIVVGDKHYGDNPLAPVEYESDTAPYKPLADVVLVGSAYSAEGARVTQLDVRLRVGSLDKRLRIFGDRHWRFGSYLSMVPTISAPQPFEQMPIRYDRAFGGMDPPSARFCAENLAGTGFIGLVSPKSVHEKKLPNIEDPDHLISGCETHPKPVGFGFYGRGWQPRLKFAGTYDEKYRAERAPLLPLDFSDQFFNGAHPDLQIADYLKGGEQVELDNLSPTGKLEFRLPRESPQIAITRFDVDAVDSPMPVPEIELARGLEEDDPISPNLDTLVLFPDKRMFCLIYRAVFRLRSLEQIDVARIRVSVPERVL